MSTTSVAGILAEHIALPVLATIVVGLRFYIRFTGKSKLQTDDWLQLISLALFIGMAAVAIYGVDKHTFGYSSGDYPLTDPPPGLFLVEKLWFIYQIMQIAALTAIKTAALLFYRRIFASRTNRPLDVVIWVLIGIVNIWGICFIGYYIGICGSHVHDAWEGIIPFVTYCYKTLPYEEAYAASDFILDTFILIVPQPSIWSLHMKLRRKIAISCVFLFAIVGYSASIARFVTNIRLVNNTAAGINQGPDIQFEETQAVWYAGLETGFSLIALNLPAIWPILANISIESIVNSIQSALSLHSIRGSQTTITQTRKYNDSDGQNSTHDGVELVPRSTQAGITTTTKPDWKNNGRDGFTHENAGPGIHVQKSLQVSEQMV